MITGLYKVDLKPLIIWCNIIHFNESAEAVLKIIDIQANNDVYAKVRWA